MTRKGFRVHYDRRSGNLVKTYCLDGHRYTNVRDKHAPSGQRMVADLTSPCPLCDKTAAANMAAWKVLLNWMIPPRPETQHIFEAPKVATVVNRSDADLSEIDTTGFHVTNVPEGVMPKVNREGNIIRKGGEVVMQTVDFRSDEAVTRRMVGGSSKWGKGNVTGSTSVCSSWAVPAKPNSDSMASSHEVLKDLRSSDMQNTRARDRKTPRKGKHNPRKPIVVRRYTV